MAYNAKILWVAELFGFDIWITQTIFITWIVMAVVLALAIAARVMLKNFQTIPAGFQNFIESAVEYFAKLGKAASARKSCISAAGR